MSKETRHSAADWANTTVVRRDHALVDPREFSPLRTGLGSQFHEPRRRRALVPRDQYSGGGGRWSGGVRRLTPAGQRTKTT